jgi:hypothetical protein
MVRVHISCALLATFLLASSINAGAQTPGVAGYVIVLKGNATVRKPDGTINPLTRRSPITAGDTFITSPDSSLQVRMEDNTLFVLRANSEFTLDAFDENKMKQRPGQTLLMSMVRGCIRYMVGEIGDSAEDEVRLDTPFASLNINALVVFEACLNDSSLETVVSTGSLMVSNNLGNLELDFNGQFDFAETGAGKAPAGSRVQPAPPPAPPASTGPVRLRPQEDFDIIPLGKDEE